MVLSEAPANRTQSYCGVPFSARRTCFPRPAYPMLAEGYSFSTIKQRMGDGAVCRCKHASLPPGSMVRIPAILDSRLLC